MTNRILSVSLVNRSLDPASAELSLVVRPECIAPTTELRGRLHGPRCPYAETIEIGYPLLPPRPDQARTPETLSARIAIPEPSFWDPQSPFLYVGNLELWQGGTCHDRVKIVHGMREISLGPRGLRINGRVVSISGREVDQVNKEQARSLHDQGCNLFLISPHTASQEMLELADELGFLLLIKLVSIEECSRDQLSFWLRSPSTLGFLLEDCNLEQHLRQFARGTILVGCSSDGEGRLPIWMRRTEGALVMLHGTFTVGSIQSQGNVRTD